MISENQIKKKKRRTKKDDYSQAKESSFAEANSEQNINGGESGEKEATANNHSNNNNAEVETAGDNFDSTLAMPYEFLKYSSPPLHTIFVPHFTVKSINFVVTVIFIITFIIFLIFNYVKPQSDITWNCSLYQLQTKYYPRLRYSYEIWRVFVSAVFHSNIPNFLLDLFSLQIYGYFVEWYYGKLKYVMVAVTSLLISHFLSCVAESITFSTTSIALLYSILALKLVFFYEYWDYKPLVNRRVFLYLLFGLIFGINLIPIFVSNNIDYSVYIGGFVIGLLFGIFFYLRKKQDILESQQEEMHLALRIFKWSIPFVIFVIGIVFIALTFALDDRILQALNDSVEETCREGQA